MRSNGPIFSLIAFRVALFSQVRWQYQRFNQGRPGDLWSDQTLDILNGDPVLNMIRHRAETHALLFLALFAVPMAWAVSRIHRQAHQLPRVPGSVPR
jgi:hypothetical protein